MVKNIFFSNPVTHLLCLLVAPFLCLNMIRNMPQGVWIFSHCIITHFLRLKMIRDIRPMSMASCALLCHTFPVS